MYRLQLNKLKVNICQDKLSKMHPCLCVRQLIELYPSGSLKHFAIDRVAVQLVCGRNQRVTGGHR